MASFKFNGVDYLSAKFEQLAKLSDDDKKSIIMPAAEFLQQRHIEAIKSTFIQHTGALAASIKIAFKSDDNGVYAHVAPTGNHPRSTMGKRNHKGSKQKAAKNSEIAYVLEHGSPRIKAYHWMEKANDGAAEEMQRIQQDAFDRLLAEKGL